MGGIDGEKGFSNVKSREQAAPKVSVIMPVYNTRQDWLDLAIGSILEQTFRDFELIIIDDGSDEATQRQLSSYKDARIVLLRQEKNTNPAIARNEGLKVARGKYIAFMDSDDISLSERFEKQVEYLESHPDIGLLATRVSDAVHPWKVERWGERNHPRQIECDLLLAGNVLCTSSVMVRREILCREGIEFRGSYFVAQDYKMWAELVGKAKIVRMDEVLVRYRKRDPNPKREKQEEMAARIRTETLTGRFGVRKEEAEELASFLHVPGVAFDEERLQTAVRHTIEQLEAAGYEREYTESALRWAIRKVYYRTKTWEGQVRLMRMPWGKEMRLGRVWRLWCFVTRGIL